MHNIPSKYRGAGVLQDILLVAVRDNWGRVKENYNRVYDWLEQRGQDRDIDKALLRRFRRDIRQDGPDFIDTPDGVASRLNCWLREAFPQAFGLTYTEVLTDGAALHGPYDAGGIYDDNDEDSRLNDEIVRKW